MAQDFRAAFGLGEDEKHISTVDAEGVALAAIQELYRELKTTEASSREKDARIARQSVQIRQLAAEVQKLETLEAKLAALEAQVERMRSGPVSLSSPSP
jgi:hypothetical protein